MAYSGFLLNGLLDELKEKLIGGRINKIYQPSNRELTFTVRNNGTNHLLYISANNNYAQINILDSKFENPVKPPNFCMLLRKLLQNGFITNIEQLEFERILVIHIASSDELGYITTKKLIIEIMGKHSNIILINNNDIIFDSIKRVSPFMSSIRQIMPNQPFKFIEYDKINILNMTKKNLFDGLNEFENMKTTNFIFTYFQGFGPMLAKEMCFRSGISFRKKNINLTDELKTNLFENLSKFKAIAKEKKYEPYLIQNSTTGETVDFSPIFLESFSNENFIQVKTNNFSALVDKYYNSKLVNNSIKQKANTLISLLNKKIKLLEHKISNLNDDLVYAENADEFKIKGELITANIYKIKKGIKIIIVENYYDNNTPIEIDLVVNISPSRNAQRYFKKYNKLKTAQIEVKKQLTTSIEELNYFENVLNSIEIAEDNTTIDEIKLELIESGYIKDKQKYKKKKKSKNKIKINDDFKKYRSSDGFLIFAGKNNKQNDYLTLKYANNTDLWFHTKDIAGTHVIIKKHLEVVPEQTLLEAAMIAAYNSKGKLSSNVPVDYTLVKNVSKPSGAKPGMVIYVKNKTLYVTPIIKTIEKLTIK